MDIQGLKTKWWYGHRIIKDIAKAGFERRGICGWYNKAGFFQILFLTLFNTTPQSMSWDYHNNMEMSKKSHTYATLMSTHFSYIYINPVWFLHDCDSISFMLEFQELTYHPKGSHLEIQVEWEEAKYKEAVSLYIYGWQTQPLDALRASK